MMFSCFNNTALLDSYNQVKAKGLKALSIVLYSSLSLQWESWLHLQFRSVQSLSHVQLFVTPWMVAHQASLSITNSWSLLKLMSTELVMDNEAWRSAVHGVAKSCTWLNDWTELRILGWEQKCFFLSNVNRQTWNQPLNWYLNSEYSFHIDFHIISLI